MVLETDIFGVYYIFATKTLFQMETSHVTNENIPSEYSARLDLLSYVTVLHVIQSDENSQRIMISSCKILKGEQST